MKSIQEEKGIFLLIRFVCVLLCIDVMVSSIRHPSDECLKYSREALKTAGGVD